MKNLLIILTFFVTACGAEMGPPGEPGEEGERGRDGEEGERGRDGEDGAQGEPGEDGHKPMTSIHCSEIDGGWLFTYDAVEWSDASVLVTCSIGTGQDEHSKTLFYGPDQNGRRDLGCILSVDADRDDTGGWWRFSATGGNSTVVYDDPSSSIHGDLVTFSNCTAVDL